MLETSVVARVYERYKQNLTENDAIDHVCKLKIHFPFTSECKRIILFIFLLLLQCIPTAAHAAYYMRIADGFLDCVHPECDSFEMHAV